MTIAVDWDIKHQNKKQKQQQKNTKSVKLPGVGNKNNFR